MKTIRVNEALQLEKSVFIDVRSPGEFAEGTILGAVNIPLFSDEERAFVGTTYKQVSPEKAREVGLDIVAPKLPNVVRQIKEVIKDRTPIFFCWRGGERSKSLCAILQMMMIDGYRLEGGYKAYRTFIIEQLTDYKLSAQVIVLHGYTGSGKTMIIQRLAELGHPVIDLEGLAGHRGSAFGRIGIDKVRNQKQFDTLLYHRLEELKNVPYILLEAESKRIGQVNMPDFLFEKKEQGLPILVTASLETRASRILEEYVAKGITEEFLQVCSGSLHAISKKLIKQIGRARFEEVERALWARDLHYVTKVLLVEYYDPLYQHSQDRYKFVLEVDVDNIEYGVGQIDHYLRAKITSGREE